MSVPQVVILCGGQGTRLREHTQTIPKALVEVGGRPILWHVMKLYRHYGFDEFLLCLGYKGELIRGYVEAHPEDWTVSCIDTGADTQTGGRVLRCLPQVNGDTVFVTYGDGLADIDLQSLLAFHRGHGLAATITCVNPESPFGIVELDANDRVVQYQRLNELWKTDKAPWKVWKDEVVRKAYNQAQLQRLVLGHIDLPVAYFAGKRILDAGCGAVQSHGAGGDAFMMVVR